MQQELRAGMNAYFLKRPRTGSGQYLQHLLAAAPKEGIDYTLWSFGQADAGVTSQYPVRLLDLPPGIRHENLAKPWFEQVTLPRAAERSKIDLLHYPYWASPLRKMKIPVVVTIHDVIPMLLPAYRGSVQVRAYTALVARAARHASRIIADSECSKRDIVRLLGLEPERVDVVYLAAEERFTPAERRPAERIAALRERLGTGNRFVLYIGGLDVRKNVPLLVEAYAEALRRLREQGDCDPCRLVIVGDIGQTGSSFFPDPRPVAEQHGLVTGRDILYPGTVPDDEDKADLLAAATVFAFPSEYEGFGLPPLEAMASGAPVVCSTGGSLPEITGDAALVHAPHDIRTLADGLQRVLSDAELRRTMSARGLAQAQKFSWARCAAETRAVYDLAVSGRRAKRG